VDNRPGFSESFSAGQIDCRIFTETFKFLKMTAGTRGIMEKKNLKGMIGKKDMWIMVCEKTRIRKRIRLQTICFVSS
jgi:hypothetical protein